MRLALGAGRVRLIRQLLTESLLLAAAGGVAGLLLAQWATASLIATGWMMPIHLEVQPNLHVLGFTAGASLFTGVLFGLAPAFRATQLELFPALKVSTGMLSAMSRRQGKGPFDLGSMLVVLQVAMTVVLVIGAGLLIQTLTNLRNLDTGFNPNILLFRVDPTLNGYKAERIANLYKELSTKLNALPGVLSASFSMDSPSGSLESGNMFFEEAQTSAVQVNILRVGPRLLRHDGDSAVLGRALGSSDHVQDAPKVALVNEALARRYFSARNPMGKRLGGRDNALETEIVGVVADAKYDELRKEISPTVYLPYLPTMGDGRGVCFELRTAGNPTSLIPAVRRVVGETDSNLPLFGVNTQTQQIDQTLLQERLIARLSGLFALLALVLAWVGLYGVMSYAVAAGPVKSAFVWLWVPRGGMFLGWL